jgi:hypothetical protein
LAIFLKFGRDRIAKFSTAVFHQPGPGCPGYKHTVFITAQLGIFYAVDNGAAESPDGDVACSIYDYDKNLEKILKNII